MTAQEIEKIKALPEYQQLVKARSRLAWQLSLLMLAVYYGFILLLAFKPDFFQWVISGEHTTVGFPIGVGIIVLAFVLTGIYVRKANHVFDALNARIKEKMAL